jgi:hypothetical protein
MLCVRVAVAANAPELNDVRWEMLADPRHNYELLARGRNSSLARYCPPRYGTGPPEPLASRLRSVALVANPATRSACRRSTLPVKSPFSTPAWTRRASAP